MVVSKRTCEQPRLSVVWFPHACGLAGAYRCFESSLPKDWAHAVIEYPGHGARAGRLCHNMGQLADTLLDDVRAMVRQPYAFIGHSMGALVAFRMAIEVSLAGLPAPRFLVVSGRGAPPSDSGSCSPLARRSEEALASLLDLSNGTPTDFLEHEQSRRELLDVARADIELCDTYRSNARLGYVPIVAYYSSADRLIEPRSMLDWAARTSGPFSVRRFEGDHFYLFGNRTSFTSAIRRDAEHLSAIFDT